MQGAAKKLGPWCGNTIGHRMARTRSPAAGMALEPAVPDARGREKANLRGCPLAVICPLRKQRSTALQLRGRFQDGFAPSSRAAADGCRASTRGPGPGHLRVSMGDRYGAGHLCCLDTDGSMMQDAADVIEVGGLPAGEAFGLRFGIPRPSCSAPTYTSAVENRSQLARHGANAPHPRLGTPAGQPAVARPRAGALFRRAGMAIRLGWTSA